MKIPLDYIIGVTVFQQHPFLSSLFSDIMKNEEKKAIINEKIVIYYRHRASNRILY
jgi:hypothetical protein